MKNVRVIASRKYKGLATNFYIGVNTNKDSEECLVLELTNNGGE